MTEEALPAVTIDAPHLGWCVSGSQIGGIGQAPHDILDFRLVTTGAAVQVVPFKPRGGTNHYYGQEQEDQREPQERSCEYHL